MVKIRGIVVSVGLLLAATGATATTYTTVQESVSGAARTSVDVTAHCPAGYTPTGGGYDMPTVLDKNLVIGGYYVSGVLQNIYGQNFYLPAVVVSISRPSDDGSGWRVAGFVNMDTQLYAWARCASLN